MTLWEQISINFAVLINLLVAFFYPFSDGPGGKCHGGLRYVVLLSQCFSCFLYIVSVINKSEATKKLRDREENGKCTNATNRRSRVGLSTPFYTSKL